ncbi:type IV pilus twitching motility protein PilT [Thiohalophilus sp.]|uniref:type IV pilus twitching motility protein PilT n=1 Tax=Thiohalophilus sp. TaxID=3028392 RepID=UPI002ACD5E7C|nr:type IV pilus twitching motility protein PilT [Thiohalophilus sp.]MDZ7663210.1 type IV pilus twitching motility protein PilT [Thiohalophilus sp.]
MARIDTFLELVVKQNGSDLHMVAGNPPRVRINGDTFAIKYRELTAEETQDLIFEIMSNDQQEYFEENNGVDFAYEAENLARFRVNVFQHLSGIGAVFRVIPAEIKSLNDLGLPPVLKNLARQRKGLILVTGPTGSGKSTSLAAMVDFINTERKGHILTIEDPIEFVHHNKNCLISQREVGEHTSRFANALHSALREDPDVILVGELRDLETIHLAITAAEMGILVMATLHTSTAASTVDRILNVFPSGEEAYVRTMLSTSLVGIISQQLVRRCDNKGRVAALEIMINNPAIANVLREGKTEQLENIIQGGAMQGMQLMDTALKRLVDSQIITGEDAYLKARSKHQFAKHIDGYEEAVEDMIDEKYNVNASDDVEEIVLSSEPDLKK